MHTECYFVYAAILVKAVALTLFMRQKKHITPWIYWNLSVMFSVMMLRMWMLAENYYVLAKYASMFIAIEVLCTVVYLRRIILKTQRQFNEMKQENKTLAHRLAEHLAESRKTIEYYEDEAARNGTTLWKNRAGKLEQKDSPEGQSGL